MLPRPSARTRLIVTSVLATIGGVLLAVIVGRFWTEAGDDLAYWIAGHRLAVGEPIYADPAVAFEPFAFHYMPAVAQVLAPVAALVPAVPFVIAYRALLLLALWALAGRRMLDMLALLAFVPIAYSLRVENVEIFMALAVVVGLSRWPWAFTLAAIVKVSPIFGLVYLAMQRRWRDVAVSTALGGAVLGVSYLLQPELWPQFFLAVSDQPNMVGNSLIPVPYFVRAGIGLVLAVTGGLLGRRRGELLLLGAITIANPGLSLQGFAVLAAAVPIWRAGPDGLLAQRLGVRAGVARRGSAPVSAGQSPSDQQVSGA